MQDIAVPIVLKPFFPGLRIGKVLIVTAVLIKAQPYIYPLYPVELVVFVIGSEKTVMALAALLLLSIVVSLTCTAGSLFGNPHVKELVYIVSLKNRSSCNSPIGNNSC
jgi:hypothetical protein